MLRSYNINVLINNRKIVLLLNTILAFSVIVAFLSFVRDINNTIYYGGVDLRSNVIGARLLLEDKDPYYIASNSKPQSPSWSCNRFAYCSIYIYSYSQTSLWYTTKHMVFIAVDFFIIEYLYICQSIKI